MSPTRARARAAIVCATSVLVSMTAAQADSVTLARDRSSAIVGCRIQIISGGRVFVQDKDGKLLEFSLAEIQSLQFDELPLLAEAEPLLSARRFADSIPLLLRAAVDAKTNAQRIWALAQLSKAHAAAGQYVEAAAHAASVYALDDSAHWESLEPKAPDPATPQTVSFTAAAEAMDRLQRARSAVSNIDLRASIDRMTVIIQPLYRKLADSHKGDPYRPNATMSGIPTAVIRGEQPASASTAAPAPAENAGTPPSSSPGSTAKRPSQPTRAAAPSPVSADEIDSLLASGDFAKATAACQAVARNPGDRDLGHFLHQYGRSLLGSGQRDEAAVMFARCALLFAGSLPSEQSLIALANIYATDYRKPETARRLLNRAIDSATARGDSATVSAANSALDSLAHPSADPSP